MYGSVRGERDWTHHSSSSSEMRNQKVVWSRIWIWYRVPHGWKGRKDSVMVIEERSVLC